MTTIVAYDPFAREGLERETHINYHGLKSCLWCGTNKHLLYSYISESNLIPVKQPKLFCNKDCYESYTYHGS